MTSPKFHLWLFYADKEGFLRSDTALIQTIGRAARHVEGKVIMYADKMTNSMKRAIDETDRRRKVQAAYNKEHGITPKTIYKSVEEIMDSTRVADARPDAYGKKKEKDGELVHAWEKMSREEKMEMLSQFEQQMMEAASNLEFERAAEIRDRMDFLKQDDLAVAKK